jgi:hypothetical protein
MSFWLKAHSTALLLLITFFNAFSQDTDSLSITKEAFSSTLKINESGHDSVITMPDTLKQISSMGQVNDTSSFTPNTGEQLEVYPLKIEDGKIKVDGELNEAQWKNAVRLSNFSEVSPGDNSKPPVQTETYVLYDNDNIYFGYICHDEDMKNLHVTFADRDKIFQDDFAGFFIDTYSNSKQAYEFLTNPYGIQGDLLWSNGNEDASYDAVWSSDAKIYKDKWTCEIAIPFKSIRFPNKDIQDWKFHVYRIRPRKNRDEYFWCPISRDDPSLFTKAGTLKGLKNIKGGKNLEVLPYVLGSQSRELLDFSNANSGYLNGDPNIDIGLNVKYGITSNLTTDLAINPDFSQVESDAGVININSNFALFLPERRPFFLEGNNIFSTPYDVVYTRSINSPSLAGKITGKIGKVDVGYIAAYDHKTPFLVPLDESSSVFSTRIHSLSNILRLKHDLADDSYIGMMFTDREYKDTTGNFFKYNGFNRVLGVDGKLRFMDKYSFVFQLLHFNTHELNDSNLYYDPDQRFDEGKYTAGFDGESFSGTGGYLSFRRSARHWNFDLNYDFIPSAARMDNGFLSNNNFKTLSSWQGYTIYPESKWLVRIEPSLYGYLKHNFENKLREQFVQAQCYIQFAHQINANLSMFLVNNELVSGVYSTDVLRPSINMNINTMPKFTFGFYYTRGKSIVRFLAPSYIGYTQQLQLWNTFKPLEQLSFITDYSYAELANNSDLNDKLYAGYIVRNRMSYQFSKQLFLRLITEYNSFSNSFRVDPLLSYKINPFTIFYLGSTHNIEDIPSQSNPSRFIETERQIFMKFQYLWRI